MSTKATIREIAVFPETPRVIYRENPLEEVICQLRFPPILRIEAESPAAFQEAIRSQYPLFEETPGETLPVPNEIAKKLPEALIRLGNPSYTFASENGTWKVSLTRDFIALTTSKYERWEDFRRHLELPLKAFVEQYTPAFYTRIGLRYRDVIRRSILGLADVHWAVLLKPQVAGELSVSEVAKAIERAARDAVFILDENESKLHVRHGLARRGTNGEECYVVDSDFFTTQKTEINDVGKILDTFNRQAGCFFRWCITDRLDQAMGPRPADRHKS